MNMEKILLLEDDLSLISGLSFAFKKQGYELDTARTIKEAQDFWKERKCDMLVIDVTLPDGSGFDFCKEVRQASRIPIIFLTALDDEMNTIMGLDIGADDYITKPFEVKELLARIHAVMRRTEDNDAPKEKKLCYDKLIVNLDSYELIVNGKKVDTPPKEMELLYHLAASPNIVFTRNQLLDEVWGFDYFGDSRTVDVHIKRLREKLEGVSDQWSLQTVWGVGYKFEVAR